MNNHTLNPLTRISDTLNTGTISSKQAALFFEQSIEYLLTLEADLTDDIKATLSNYIPILEQLVPITEDNIPEYYYYQSIIEYIKGNFEQYYKNIEKYFQTNTLNIDWKRADTHFFSIIYSMPTLCTKNIPSNDQLLKTLSSYATKYCLHSTFEIYCKYLCSQENPEDKINLLQDIKKKDPNWALTWMDEGDLHYEQEHWLDALNSYKHALEVFDNDDTYHSYLFFRIAYISGILDDLDTAIENYEKCLAINSTYKYAHNNLGNCYKTKKEYAKATKHFQLELAQYEKEDLAWRNLGDTYYEQEQWLQALSPYEHALKIHERDKDNDIYLLLQIADIRCNLNNLDAAIENCEKCLAIDSTEKVVHYALGFYLKCKKQYSEAEKHFKLALAQDENYNYALEGLGELYYEQKQWEAAFDTYRQAEKNSDEPSAYLFFRLAYSADNKKDISTAIDYYKKCIEVDASYQYAHNNLGYCLNKQKRFAEAEPYFRYAIEHDENKRYGCQNLYKSLKKLNKIDELLILVQQYPKYFKAKEYRHEIDKYLSEKENIKTTQQSSEYLSTKNNKNEINQYLLKGGNMEATDELQKQLKEKTTNDYAGIIKVSPENSNIILYSHQKNAIQHLNEWKNQTKHGAGLLVLPTGGGKTLTASYWLMQSILDKGGKVLWIAHRHELLEQALQSFWRVCYQDLSPHKSSYSYRIISGNHDKAVHIRPEDDILIASKSSLTYNLSYIQKNWIEKNKNNICMIIDEAHHAPAGGYRKLAELLQKYGGNFHLLGLTATPFRTAEKEQGLLKKLFQDDILYKIDLRTLIERGILAEPIFHSINTGINMTDLFHTGDADAVLERIVNERGFDINSISEKTAKLIAENRERNWQIVDTYTKNQQIYGKTIVFALNQNMAIAINTLFQERGIRSEYVISGTQDSITGVSRSNEDNEETLRRFRTGEIDVLVNVNILTEGTDLPKVQSVFLTRPTKSKILMTQMIGRALRGEKAGGTDKAYIVSFIDDWQEQIAWVNPEKLFIDTNADFENQTSESQKYAMRLVSIAKLEEFAKLANDSLDTTITENFSFLERIPVGLYQFTYLPDEDEESKNCTILVYDCMQKSYEDLMQWLKNIEPATLTNLDASAAHIDQLLFGQRDKLLGYHKQDIYDILAYYHQNEVLPQWIPLEERAEYDISVLAKNIINNKYSRIEEDDYINSEWQRADSKWAAFLGYHNIKAFTSAIDQECRRLMHPERYQPPKSMPITQQEEIQIQNLPLEEIRRRYPELGEKLRNAVFEKYQDKEGYYYSADSGYRSKNKLDFQIDHIKPMKHGGLTRLENLQLLTRRENALKSDQIPL